MFQIHTLAGCAIGSWMSCSEEMPYSMNPLTKADK